MGVFRALAELICDYEDYLIEQDRIYEEQMKKKRIEKERKIFLRKQKEKELWLQITEEEHKNPDEFRVLPYGWSPFGITI